MTKYKDGELEWFNQLQKIKMMKHSNDPMDLNYNELLSWLIDEVHELRKTIKYESKPNAIMKCAYVGNIVYFIARKLKRGM